MLELHLLTTDGKAWVSVDDVREALDIKKDENISLAIKKLREERERYKSNCDYFAGIAQDRLRDRNKLELGLREALGTVDEYADILGLVRKLKQERDELKEKQSVEDARCEFLRELSCSLGFGNPVVKPDNIDQKEKDILERVEKLKVGVWPCENTSTFAEFLRKEFPKFCKAYNVTPLARPCSIHDWMHYIFEKLTDYRDLADGNYKNVEGLRKEKKEFLDSVCEVLNIAPCMTYQQIITEVKNIVDCNDELTDFRVGCLEALNIDNDELIGSPRQNDKYILEQVEKLRDDLREDYAELKHGNELLIEFRDDVAKAIGMGYPTTNNVILNNVKYVYKDREDAYGMVTKLNDQVTALEKAKEELQQMLVASQKQVKDWTNRCDSLEDQGRDLSELRKNAIEELKTRGFLFRYEEDETLPEIFAKLLKRYDWTYASYKEQYRLRQMWHLRWESENERANGEHKRVEKIRKDVTVLANQVELLEQSNTTRGNELVALQSFKNECRKLKEEKTKVIAALGQDIWDDCLK